MKPSGKTAQGITGGQSCTGRLDKGSRSGLEIIHTGGGTYEGFVRKGVKMDRGKPKLGGKDESQGSKIQSCGN